MEIKHKHNNESIYIKEITFGTDVLRKQERSEAEAEVDFRLQKHANPNSELITFNCSVSESDINNKKFSENLSKLIESKKDSKANPVLNSFPKESEKKKINFDTSEISGLNPDIGIITEKDPYEIIILPKKELQKSHSTKNRNQPL